MAMTVQQIRVLPITLRDMGLQSCARPVARRGRGVVALLSSDSYNFSL